MTYTDVGIILVAFLVAVCGAPVVAWMSRRRNRPDLRAWVARVVRQ